MGPILQDLKKNVVNYFNLLHDLLIKALTIKEMPVPETILPIKITAQGGVGTAEEHEFLLEEYQLDSIGWGSAFLLVPEATSVDALTRKLLTNAKEDDFYLSTISPLEFLLIRLKGFQNDY